MQGMWTDAFDRLREAVLNGATVAEVERLALIELGELLDAEEDGDQ
ncbi:hypothetical protein [Pseudonocardia sp. Ae505_Ps2]|nr:hypothetical protein [Pseudonocardia sp. Ae505_Ps2]